MDSKLDATQQQKGSATHSWLGMQATAEMQRGRRSATVNLVVPCSAVLCGVDRMRKHRLHSLWTEATARPTRRSAGCHHQQAASCQQEEDLLPFLRSTPASSHASASPPQHSTTGNCSEVHLVHQPFIHSEQQGRRYEMVHT